MDDDEELEIARAARERQVLREMEERRKYETEVTAKSNGQQVIAKELPKTHDVRALAMAATPEAIRTLYEICVSGSSEAARVAAANAILDRGHGKVDGYYGVQDDVGYKMTREEMIEIRDGLRMKALEGKAAKGDDNSADKDISSI